MGRDRGQEIGVADSAPGLVLGGVGDKSGEVLLHPLDQRLAADGAGGEIFRVRVDAIGQGLRVASAMTKSACALAILVRSAIALPFESWGRRIITKVIMSITWRLVRARRIG